MEHTTLPTCVVTEVGDTWLVWGRATLCPQNHDTVQLLFLYVPILLMTQGTGGDRVIPQEKKLKQSTQDVSFNFAFEATLK